MPYEVHIVVRLYDMTELDEHRKLVQRAAQLQSDLEEAAAKADAEIEISEIEWFGNDCEPEDWNPHLEDGIRYLQGALPELARDGFDPPDWSIVKELADEGYSDDEADAILEELKTRVLIVPRGAPGCTCGTPPFAPREPASDCPHHTDPTA